MSAIKHFKTITHHRNLVRKYCFKIGLYRQGLLHDLSKYSYTEFSEGAKYWCGTESPNNPARRDVGYSLAWMHHKGRNKHHFDYWIDYDLKHKGSLHGVDMPRKYIAELICDRIAAAETYNKESYNDKQPLEYYLKSEEGLWFVSENTKKDVAFLLRMLAEKGRTETFSYIKNVYLKGREL